MAVAYNNKIITDGLVLYLDTPNPRSANGTVWRDISGNDIPVNIINPGAATQSNRSTYFQFTPATYNSTATYYEITDSRVANLTSNVTLETCIYIPSYTTSDSTGTTRIVSARIAETSSPYGFNIAPDRTGSTGGISQEINTDPGATWFVTEDPYVPRSLIDFNKWIYVTQVQDDTAKTMKVYVNGELRNTLTYTGTPNSGGGIDIGRGYYSGTRNVTGRVSFVRLYNRPLSTVEVVQNYTAMRGRFESTYQPLVVDSSLKLWLDASNPTSYSGTGSTWTDLSGNSNNVTLFNSPTYSTLNGGMLTFNGSYGVTLSTSVLSSTAYTKIAWFRFTGLGGPNNIMSGNGGDHAFWGGNSTKLRAGHQNTGYVALESTTDLVVNTWYFGAVTFNTTTGWRLYLNGKLEAISSNTTTFNGVGNIEIGGFGGAANLLNGDVAIAIVYNRALQYDEVVQNFNSSRARFGL